MRKLIAIVNVIAWSGFWAFGYLALSADVSNTRQMITAAILAALGAALGLWAYFRLIRINEDTGYARRPNRADRSHLDIEVNGEEA
ncbi:hypothetical protein SAMN05216196_10225 [Lutimaribacter pacificus]|uniref:Uncharacterized protein n=1 Tax=Lutimaribacter pacificus TaxID=391948 RepID=A0A1H0DZN5_9RHOB|nr:hypothetical protein [Lutimaribacter pacificus]SDN75451.1 hypothetical protein SAMN05216196_10225 [Lutimaribacter pacificus]SHK58272.1 hypothetical protein SAMN05444142_106263 [Lutimaribacter pacificus]